MPDGPPQLPDRVVRLAATSQTLLHEHRNIRGRTKRMVQITPMHGLKRSQEVGAIPHSTIVTGTPSRKPPSTERRYFRRFLNRHRCSGDAGLSVVHPLETIGVAAVE
jgi:hypothetical protein